MSHHLFMRRENTRDTLERWARAYRRCRLAYRCLLTIRQHAYRYMAAY